MNLKIELHGAIEAEIVSIVNDVHARLLEVEACVNELPKGPEKRQVRKAVKNLHGYLQGVAVEKLGLGETSGVVAFSGGTDKPDPDPED
jgi:hypothetical protein